MPFSRRRPAILSQACGFTIPVRPPRPRIVDPGARSIPFGTAIG